MMDVSEQTRITEECALASREIDQATITLKELNTKIDELKKQTADLVEKEKEENDGKWCKSVGEVEVIIDQWKGQLSQEEKYKYVLKGEIEPKSATGNDGLVSVEEKDENESDIQEKIIEWKKGKLPVEWKFSPILSREAEVVISVHKEEIKVNADLSEEEEEELYKDIDIEPIFEFTIGMDTLMKKKEIDTWYTIKVEEMDEEESKGNDEGNKGKGKDEEDEEDEEENVESDKEKEEKAVPVAEEVQEEEKETAKREETAEKENETEETEEDKTPTKEETDETETAAVDSETEEIFVSASSGKSSDEITMPKPTTVEKQEPQIHIKAQLKLSGIELIGTKLTTLLKHKDEQERILAKAEEKLNMYRKLIIETQKAKSNSNSSPIKKSEEKSKKPAITSESKCTAISRGRRVSPSARMTSPKKKNKPSLMQDAYDTTKTYINKAGIYNIKNVLLFAGTVWLFHKHGDQIFGI